MLELPPVDAGELPMSPVQPAPDTIKPAKEAPMKSRDDSCVTRFTSVDRVKHTARVFRGETACGFSAAVSPSASYAQRADESIFRLLD